jgi:quinol monooxygenase YgiN
MLGDLLTSTGLVATMPTSLVVLLRVEPTQVEGFLEIARVHAAHSMTVEPGCLSFQVMRVRDETDRVILVEVYEDDEALEAHWQSAHMQAYLERVGSMIVERQRYRCTL